ncbi:MAG: hypothetical protein M1823_005913 [Watsoniomyces obsoletus]|nr:MAG: hypothetical protein M1823_005913 [Watsoniomyces obsoletus]
MSEEQISHASTRTPTSSGYGMTAVDRRAAPGPPSTSNSARASMDQPPRSQPGHQRFVFADPIAFQYLEGEPSTTVLERRRELQGYEVYLVEQWLCAREHSTYVIVTYTGDPSHSVVVSVLGIPTDEASWSSRLRFYFSGAEQYRARRKETPWGIVMVTNLSWFPSALTVIRVPDGDVKKHREEMIVNEDLKRLGCSGRAGLKLDTPADATQAKFYQLYKVSDRIPLSDAVIELVKLCQIALNLFDKLGSSYADGLLCDVTEGAINEWWAEMGTDFYHVEPRDGILGPTTVAAMLGLLTGARNRLAVYGAPVAKDPFDVESLKRGIAYFRKSHKMPVSRRLDRQTLDRLHRATAKAASGEGWMVPKTVKSTMVELGGKGGEMVKGMVGAKDKPGIAEVETLNYDRFVELVRGERCKWLWHGKPRKSQEHADGATASPDDVGKADHAGLRWLGTRHGSTDVDPASEQGMMGSRDPTRTASEPIGNATDPVGGEREWHIGRAALKSMTDRRNDARRGFERIRDAVGISSARSRHQRSTTEDAGRVESGLKSVETTDTEMEPVSEAGLSRASTREPEMHVTPFRTAMEAFRREREAEDARMRREGKETASSYLVATPGQISLSESSTRRRSSEGRLLGPKDEQPELETEVENGGILTASRSRSDDAGRRDGHASHSHDQRLMPTTLRRAASASDMPTHRRRHGSWWPRHLSFSAAEEAIFVWDDLTDGIIDPTNPAEARLVEECLAEEDRWKYRQLLQLNEEVALWVRESLEAVEALDIEAGQDREEVYAMYRQCSRQYEDLLSNLNALLPDQRRQLRNAIRDLEVLGARLDYEVNNLVAKVEDVEDGVEGIERHVESLESKANEFDAEEKARETWPQWGLRIVAGIRR